MNGSHQHTCARVFVQGFGAPPVNVGQRCVFCLKWLTLLDTMPQIRTRLRRLR